MSQAQAITLNGLDQLNPSQFPEIQGQPLPTAPAQTQPAPAEQPAQAPAQTVAAPAQTVAAPAAQPAPVVQLPPTGQPVAAPQLPEVTEEAPGFFGRIFGEDGTLYTPAGVAIATGVGIAVGVGATLLCQALFGGSPTEA